MSPQSNKLHLRAINVAKTIAKSGGGSAGMAPYDAGLVPTYAS